MNKNQGAFLFDPERAVLLSVDTKPLRTADDLRNYLGCDDLGCVRFYDDYLLFFDESALQPGLRHIIRIEGYNDPFAGRLLVMHFDFSCSVPPSEAKNIQARLKLFKPVIDPVVETKKVVVDDVTSFTSFVARLETRIVETPIALG